MDFTQFSALPIEAQIAALTVGITQYVKKLLPEKIKRYTPVIAVLIGIGMTLFLKQSLLWSDVTTGFLIGFCSTSFIDLAKEFRK